MELESQAYLADNGYNLDGYTDRRFKVSVGPLVLNFPNPGSFRTTIFTTLFRATEQGWSVRLKRASTNFAAAARLR